MGIAFAHVLITVAPNNLWFNKQQTHLFNVCGGLLDYYYFTGYVWFTETGELAENSPPPEIIVKEWIYSRSNPYQKPEEVKADPLPWAVPTLQRLWFGPAVDDKRRRMRALLSCLNSDTPLVLNTAYVPQHMLLMACVLRYIMSQQRPIMRRHELDAFLCHASTPTWWTHNICKS